MDFGPFLGTTKPEDKVRLILPFERVQGPHTILIIEALLVICGLVVFDITEQKTWGNRK